MSAPQKATTIHPFFLPRLFEERIEFFPSGGNCEHATSAFDRNANAESMPKITLCLRERGNRVLYRTERGKGSNLLHGTGRPVDDDSASDFFLAMAFPFPGREKETGIFFGASPIFPPCCYWAPGREWEFPALLFFNGHRNPIRQKRQTLLVVD